MTEKKEEEIVLSSEEKQFIEMQRKEGELLEVFKKEYTDLVNKTGFAWTIDVTSPLNNLKLTIGRVQR